MLWPLYLWLPMCHSLTVFSALWSSFLPWVCMLDLVNIIFFYPAFSFVQSRCHIMALALIKVFTLFFGCLLHVFTIMHLSFHSYCMLHFVCLHFDSFVCHFLYAYILIFFEMTISIGHFKSNSFTNDTNSFVLFL